MKKKTTKASANHWKEGSVQEFLSLSDAEMEIIETRIAASRLLRQTRRNKGLTQQALAGVLKTSQSRLAKMESGDRSVSLDLIFRSLFALGVSRKKLAASL